jgi:hypothetical protein
MKRTDSQRSQQFSRKSTDSTGSGSTNSPKNSSYSSYSGYDHGFFDFKYSPDFPESPDFANSPESKDDKWNTVVSKKRSPSGSPKNHSPNSYFPTFNNWLKKNMDMKTQYENQFDFHGLNVDCALEFLDKLFEKTCVKALQNLDKPMVLYLITGAGKHSPDKVAKIRAEFKKYFDANRDKIIDYRSVFHGGGYRVELDCKKL